MSSECLIHSTSELPHQTANLGAARCSMRPSSAPLTEAANVLRSGKRRHSCPSWRNGCNVNLVTKTQRGRQHPQMPKITKREDQPASREPAAPGGESEQHLSTRGLAIVFAGIAIARAWLSPAQQARQYFAGRRLRVRASLQLRRRQGAALSLKNGVHDVCAATNFGVLVCILCALTVLVA